MNTNIENINKANEEKLALERADLEKRIEEERRGAIEKEDKRQADEEKWLNSAEGRGYTQITLRNPTQEEMLYNIIGPEDRRLTIRAGESKTFTLKNGNYSIGLSSPSQPVAARQRISDMLNSDSETMTLKGGKVIYEYCITVYQMPSMSIIWSNCPGS